MKAMSTQATVVVSPEEIEALIVTEYTRVGYMRTNQAGASVVDDDAMKAKVLELVAQREVTDKSNKSANSWTQGELYAATFPGAPGTDPKTADSLDFPQKEVRKTLMRRVWNLTNPARTGYIQKRLVGKGDGGLVLCRAQVMRGLDEINGCYVTADHSLILSDSLGPRVEALVTEANNLRAHAELLTDRQPELEPRVLRAIGSGMKRTQAALPKASGNGRARQDTSTDGFTDAEGGDS
jgi:hypothetical protein